MQDLSRFHEAQDKVIATALAELARGRKETHWMWFVFPQLRDLGRSSTAKFYGIRDLAEAEAYLADPVLARRLTEAASGVLGHAGETAESIMGSVDALKLRSSATLFREAGGGPEFQAILDAFYAGRPCPLTLAALRES